MLAASGVVTGAHVGSTTDDGWAYVGMVADPAHHGAVFFHHQDVIWCLRGEGLLAPSRHAPTDIVEQHIAHRDAGAFDLGLADRMRDKGNALGIPGAHASSLGKPLCFIRAGETTWFMPRAGAENLPASLVARNHLRMTVEG